MHVLHLSALSAAQGGMSEKIGAHDWGKTPLGPLQTWPAVLRIAVDMMLASRFPGCLVWGPQMVTLYNDAFKPVLGARPEALGCSFDEVWAESWDSLGAMVFRAYSGEAIFVENFPLMSERNGTLEKAYLTFCFSPVRDESGEVAGFLETVIDTTASIEAARQWRALAETFEQQVLARTVDRNRFWQLSTDVMLTLESDLTITAVNPAWSQVLGWEAAEMQGAAVLSLVHVDDVKQVQTIVEQLRAGLSSDNVVSRVRHKDGHYRWFNWAAMPGEQGFTAVGSDVTLEREREEALLHAETMLRHSQKMEAIGQLTDGIAHDFNNLLTGIGGSLEMLEHRLAQGRLEQLPRYIEAARKAADRATELTHQLLAFSRRQALDPRPVDLSEQIRGMADLIQQTMGPAIEVQLQFEPALWSVLVDASQLENAVLNLCLNARDAMGPGGCLRISTGNERHTAQLGEPDSLAPGDYHYLQVQDNGRGMDAGTLERAFEPFFTTKPAGQGSGLGLSMVYGFVRQSAGQAWIDSSPGTGTRVKLLLPRCFDEDSPEQEVQVLETTRSRGGRIVLIDDESILRTLVKETLEEQGYSVFDAGDANGGIRLLRELGPVDLLITDVGLPGEFNGDQVANAARMLDPQLKVLFITGLTDRRLVESQLPMPGFALMTKPFSLQALIKQVRAMLAGDQPALPEREAPVR
ncbi:ATP-binding protein [Pseudomonas sp. BJa5]|uniref:hybrid sensor histidine kinase/response regulator n=1 Tax=Pseudomonas sp. BJa5 TaxID=2936270 RepID=UPI002559A196|nr:ATP-binding protein [Pseudomonas sp. BGr12]MDL2422617.1 ATP-binding protein [Pseudomonas sp. BGr12]